MPARPWKALQDKIDGKTKPRGALGRLEDIAFRIASIQGTLTPRLERPMVIVFAGDHGIAEAGVSAYPQEVTRQMVLNFLAGGAAINVFCKGSGMELLVVDAGVRGDLPSHRSLVAAKMGHGTRNFLREPAMTLDQCLVALRKGAEIVDTVHAAGSNVVGLGEMGIGNSSSAAVLTSLLCDAPLERCVGRGSGVEDGAFRRKTALLATAVCNAAGGDPLGTLAAFGGFELAMLCGAYGRAAEHRMIVLVDGFISTAALLVAVRMNRSVLDYCFFTHRSTEPGHRLLLETLGALPILDLGLRLGEGTGAALAYPLISASVRFLVDMAAFDEAEVSGKHA